MDIEIFREFISLSEGLNVTKTSRELNIAQSTLSSHIIKLEKELGVQLIERDGTPCLTLAGREFLETASDIMGLYDEFKERVKKNRHQSEEVITVRAPQRREGFILALLNKIIDFKKDNPYATIDIQNTQSNRLFEELRDGSIDCGYFGNSINKPEVEREFELIPVVDEEFIVWMDRDSPLLDKEFLAPLDLENSVLPVPVSAGTYSGYLPPMYEELFSSFGAKANIKPRYCQSIDDFFLSKIKRDDLLILNRGSQMVAAINEANGKVFRCFKPPIYSVGYLVFRSKDNSRAVTSFKEHLLESYKETHWQDCHKDA
ncbi:LysR family transcriptional regulator [Raoultibacter phocaeensis]|uniref:LysR family transcriptional regulator n=1 Tax=Raoultibacter phocaeensis TaxID=2479841 RepID=UPI00111BBF68|nr:LysR family transcriptional regulator [Raoultibacter phocaeensis]